LKPADVITTKETVRAILDRLPGDNCSIDDVLYQLYVVQAVARGDADVAPGRTVSHEQVDADLRRKWLLSAEGHIVGIVSSAVDRDRSVTPFTNFNECTGPP
jgi:hypothetical protein